MVTAPNLLAAHFRGVAYSANAAASERIRSIIARTPFGVYEPQPVHVSDWGRIGVTPNGALIDLGSTTDDALAALDSVGTRGATVIGAGAGFVLSTNRLLGGVVGAGLGYLAGKYLANIIKATVTASKVVNVVAKAG